MDRTRKVQQTLGGKVAVVTGASSGIGAATALELARRGARVVLAARRIKELQDVEQAITGAGGQALAVMTDVRDAAQVENLVARTMEAFGPVDVLVLNAGTRLGIPFVGAAPEDIAAMLDVNLVSAILLTRAVLPDMLRRRQGVIIAVSSVAGHIPWGRDPLYSATKFGLRGFALALRRSLAGSGIAVSVIAPGFVQTRLNLENKQGLPGPEMIAARIADLAAHPRREVIVPAVNRWGVWFERLFPWALDVAARWVRR